MSYKNRADHDSMSDYISFEISYGFFAITRVILIMHV
jgi:hypothetical protein